MSYEQFVASLKARPVTIEYSDAESECRPLPNLYFCTSCTKLVDDNSALVEIDTYYCPRCLDPVLTSTAFQTKNRCKTCVECPTCFHVLRIVSADKMFRYECSACRWDSKIIGLESDTKEGLLTKLDELDSSSDRNAAFTGVLSRFQEQFKTASESNVTDMYIYNFDEDPIPKKFDGVLLDVVKGIDGDLEARSRCTHVIPVDEVKNDFEKVPEELESTTSFSIHDISTREQRLARPSTQDSVASNLLPNRVHVMTKNTLRCPTCDKFVVKPKVGATHVAFDKKQLALSYIPTVTISSPENLRANSTTDLVLYFRNPTKSAVSFTIEEAKMASFQATAKIESLPKEEISIDAYDELLEQEESFKSGAKGDSAADSKSIVFRHLNKVGIAARIVVRAGGETDVKFCASLKLKAKQPELAEYEELTVLLRFNLGPTDQ